MKTTVAIPDSLLEDARKLAAREGTTVRALVMEGLRRIVAERKRSRAFRLRRATFEGGVYRHTSPTHPGIRSATWPTKIAAHDRS